MQAVASPRSKDLAINQWVMAGTKNVQLYTYISYQKCFFIRSVRCFDGTDMVAAARHLSLIPSPLAGMAAVRLIS